MRLPRFDYIARDTRAIGDHQNISLTRYGPFVIAQRTGQLKEYSLINSARVIEDQICYDSKDANQIYELCYTRFSLHKRIYNHKTGPSLRYVMPVWY